MSGAAALRERYGALFERAPEINCQVVDRVVEGAYVIDQEFCFVAADRPSARATAIYQVEDNFIRRVWFAQRR